MERVSESKKLAQEIGRRIREKRVALGWTQNDLCDRINRITREERGERTQMRQSHISALEIGKIVPIQDTVRLIARALSCKPSEIKDDVIDTPSDIMLSDGLNLDTEIFVKKILEVAYMKISNLLIRRRIKFNDANDIFIAIDIIGNVTHNKKFINLLANECIDDEIAGLKRQKNLYKTANNGKVYKVKEVDTIDEESRIMGWISDDDDDDDDDGFVDDKSHDDGENNTEERDDDQSDDLDF